MGGKISRKFQNFWLNSEQLDMLLLSFILGIAKALSDCRAILKEVKDVDCGRAMECSLGFACAYPDFDTNPTQELCDNYECRSEIFGCPDGTDFVNVWSNTSGVEEVLLGKACLPPQLEPDDLRMNCFFDPENDFKLTIDADFPEINRHAELPDDRKFTMISDSDWESINTNQCGVQIFQDSLCEGSEEDGKVVFEVTNNTNGCVFPEMTEIIDDKGMEWYSLTVVFGFDDLMRGSGCYRRGKSYVSTCSIRASDTLWVRPGAEGDWNQIELEDETEVGFEIEMYNDSTFTNKMEGVIDINDPNAYKVYVQVKADIPDNKNNILHLKQCQSIKQELVDGTWKTIENEHIFLTNGCINSDDEDVNFLYKQNSSRIEWEDTSMPTFIVDQFSYIPGMFADTVRIKLECHALGCQRSSFDDKTTGLCQLKNTCRNRYNNLLTSRSSRIQTREEKDSKVTKTDFTITFRRQGDTVPNPSPETDTTPETNSGAAFKTAMMGFLGVLTCLL